MNSWNKLCRACLTTEESFTYFIHQNVSSETYFFCTSVQINENEDLPNALCKSCHQLLIAYAEFKRTCLESQNTLLSCSNTGRCETETLAVNKVYKSNENDETKFAVKEEGLSDHFDEDLVTQEEFSIQTSKKKVKKIHKRKKKLSKLKREAKSEIKIKRKQFLYSCELCNKKFRYHERFEAHKLEHEGKRVGLRCQPCDKTFMTWSGLQRHNESTHTTVSLESVSCRRCGRIYKSRHTLRAHEKAHGQRASCVCHVCGKRVTNVVILRAHLETHKVDRERRHTCEHCGKKFFTKTMLLSHISRQHSGRRFICEICSYPFTDKYNLAKHILKHDGKKSYKCDICEKSFATNSSLVEHKRIHSGERPFLCSYCPKRFLSKRRLTDHHRIHTGEKPHRCRMCDQRFTQRGTLQRHMKVHDKPVGAS